MNEDAVTFLQSPTPFSPLLLPSSSVHAQHAAVLVVARGDVVARETREAVEAERLDVERGHDRAVRERAADELDVVGPGGGGRLGDLAGDVAHHAAGEGVAGAGGVDDVLGGV